MRKHAKSKTIGKLRRGGKYQPFPKALRSSPGSSPATGSKTSTARAISNGSKVEMNFVDPDSLNPFMRMGAFLYQEHFDEQRDLAIIGNRAASCRIPRP